MSEQPGLEPLDEKWERALAVVAHPDDLEYGTASAVARWTSQGKEVTYLLITRGEAGINGMAPDDCGVLRVQEERNGARLVGVHVVDFLEYTDGTVEYGLPVRRDIARVIRRHRPQVLLSINHHLTWGSRALNMADHRAVGLAALDAARDAGNRWVFPELIEEGLQPWSGVHMVCFNGSPHPTHAVDVTGYLDLGIASLREHRAYIEGLGGDFDADAFLRGGARAVGSQLGCDLAVAFEVFHV